MKKHLFSDKDLISLDNFISKERDWVHKGWIKHVGKTPSVPHGPGSQLLKNERIQYEGIWIDGKMMGDGYMINFGPEKTITSVMRCKDGHPVESVTIEISVAPPKTEE